MTAVARKESMSDLKNDLRRLVEELSISESVIRYLIPDGNPFSFETELWDYKEVLPSLPQNPTLPEKEEFNEKVGDLIKDVISFHNSFGGYLVFGVADKGPQRIVGIDRDFDCCGFNKKVNSYILEAKIECFYKNHSIEINGDTKNIGLLLVPRRADSANPVRFFKDGPKKARGDICFRRETYVRIRDECRPATATSADWKFLHSYRSLPIDKAPATSNLTIPNNLPARDPELVQFVGRESELAKLRSWISDPRSPVKLLSGIGGLGKTTLAYKFSEEVADLGVANLDQVIWLSAKRKTYSSARGEQVLLTRVDYEDLNSLCIEILKYLRYSIDYDDGIDVIELIEYVVEALQIVPCLVIIDDLDTLSPEEQINVTATVVGIGQRTVGRELSSSKFLLTSRIAQALPLASIERIGGLGRDVFGEYVANISESFGIGSFSQSQIDKLFDASSGSPLFSASIVRLVCSGEQVDDAISHWYGVDGEEVRSFAFKKEIKDLQPIPSKILLAVILLGSTSIDDLSSVLNLTNRIIRDCIIKLQAYHLIACSVNEWGDTTIECPDDLHHALNIIREHLGPAASVVEDSCTAAKQKSVSSSRAIGLGIRRTILAWQDGKDDVALSVAKALKAQFPNNGDVACLLGTAYFKFLPSEAKNADYELTRAYQLRCERPELLVNLVKAKMELQDWSGLYDITRSVSSRDANRDEYLNAFILCSTKLIDLAELRGDWTKAAELAWIVIERVETKLRRKVTAEYKAKLISLKFDYARRYFRFCQIDCPRAGDQLHVFEAVVRLSQMDVFLSDILMVGIRALQVWWNDVENRKTIDTTARQILSVQVDRMYRIRSRILALETRASSEIGGVIDEVIRSLEFKGAAYGAM